MTKKKATKDMKKNGRRAKITDEEEVLDEETCRRRAVLEEMEQMSADELVEIAIRAGILTEDGKLAPPYRDDAEPSACRPTD